MNTPKCPLPRLETPAKASEPPDGVQTPSKRSGGVLGRWDVKPVPFNDSATLAFAHRTGAATPVEECKHDFFRVGSCRSGRYKCHWCNMILIET